MVTYANLVNKNGIIYNTQTGQGYPTPAALAADLGIPVTNIQWNQIQSRPDYQPGLTLGTKPVQSPAPATVTPTSTVPPPSTSTLSTAAFKDTAAYKALSTEAKDFVDIAYNLIEVGGEAEARQFANAIEQAKAIAEPYFRTQLSMAKAEVLASIAEKNADFETRKEIIERTRNELLADVASNRELLSLDQQSDVARTIKQYDEDLLKIADEAAEKGLTFATGARSRALAESRRTAQFQDVIQSSGRRYNFQIKELELKAARGDITAQRELASLRSQKGFALQQIGRAAEEVLGSSNIPTVEGYTPTGGVLGKIEEEKRRSVVSDVTGFLQLQKGFL